MRRIVPLSLITSGITLFAFGLFATLLVHEARSRCIEAGFESCVPFSFFWTLVRRSGIALVIGGTAYLRRAQRGSASRV